MSKHLLYIGFCLLLLAISSCDSPVSSKSELFYEIFIDESSVFRKLEPADPMDKVLDTEKSIPAHSDDIGIVYEIKLPSGYLLYLDYWSDNINSLDPENKIASIVANILINEEVETAKLYDEILNYFSEEYGVVNGSYGDYSWEGITQKSTAMGIYLKLDENKKAITLNFVDTEPNNR
ncbi:MAG: hypothetical protein AAFY71_20200 [Bacteroidota bacterium]